MESFQKEGIEQRQFVRVYKEKAMKDTSKETSVPEKIMVALVLERRDQTDK